MTQEIVVIKGTSKIALIVTKDDALKIQLGLYKLAEKVAYSNPENSNHILSMADKIGMV